MRRFLLLFVVVVSVLALAACSSEGEGSQDTAAPDQATDTGGGDGGGAGGEGGAESDGGNVGSGSSADSELPASVSDDFAVGIPPGWEEDLLGELGLTEATGVQLLYAEGSFDEVVAYYDDWTSSQSVEYFRAEVDGRVVYSSVETPLIQIHVDPEFEERGQTFTYLLIAVGPDG